jgi:glucosamine--fructose-6-phosphate aminotransferase (isomerizing)
VSFEKSLYKRACNGFRLKSKKQKAKSKKQKQKAKNINLGEYILIQTKMEKEALEAPLMVERQLRENTGVWTALCERLSREPASFAMTIARGSSDHAATFLKYILEVKLGLPTASAAPSVLTVYHQNLKLKGALVVGISQSGQSPDIVEMMKSARASGAITVAIVNQPNSPLASAAEYVVPIFAGVEEAVAATKSYIGSLSAILHFLAVYELKSEISEKLKISLVLDQLPNLMNESLRMDWSELIQYLRHATDSIVLGRGFGYPIAQESALKLKETSSLHGEAFSSAEFLHGPMALITKAFPVLLYLQDDQTLKGSLLTAKKIIQAGGQVFVMSPKKLVELDETVATRIFPIPQSVHPLMDSVLGIQAFYPMVARLAVARGFNPDAPLLLKKVTETR